MDHELLILGAGPGGYEAAIRAAQLGLNVGLIERDAVGGHMPQPRVHSHQDASCMMQAPGARLSRPE